MSRNNKLLLVLIILILVILSLVTVSNFTSIQNNLQNSTPVRLKVASDNPNIKIDSIDSDKIITALNKVEYFSPMHGYYHTDINIGKKSPVTVKSLEIIITNKVQKNNTIYYTNKNKSNGAYLIESYGDSYDPTDESEEIYIYINPLYPKLLSATNNQTSSIYWEYIMDTIKDLIYVGPPVLNNSKEAFETIIKDRKDFENQNPYSNQIVLEKI